MCIFIYSAIICKEVMKKKELSEQMKKKIISYIEQTTK
jgi:hypothetical protein